MEILNHQLFTLLAQTRRIRALQKLWEGDPVAWTILVVCVLLVIGWPILKSRLSRQGPEE